MSILRFYLYLDFYLGTGFLAYRGLMPNVMYRNRAGRGFDDVTIVRAELLLPLLLLDRMSIRAVA